jgi:hypothetical protein
MNNLPKIFFIIFLELLLFLDLKININLQFSKLNSTILNFKILIYEY